MTHDSRSSSSHCIDDCDRRDHHKFRDEVYETITGRIYDDRCCDLVKRSYSYWNDKLSFVINQTTCELTRLVRKCKIGRREFEIRYALFQLSVQKLNRLVVCALRKVLTQDSKKGHYKHDDDFYTHGCFTDDYCQNSTASAIVIALSNLRVLVKIALNLDLDRSAQECSIRLTLERTREALKIATSTEGCFRGGCDIAPRVCRKF